MGLRAKRKADGRTRASPEIAAKISKTPVRVGRVSGPPSLFGVLAELDRMKHSWSGQPGACDKLDEDREKTVQERTRVR